MNKCYKSVARIHTNDTSNRSQWQLFNGVQREAQGDIPNSHLAYGKRESVISFMIFIFPIKFVAEVTHVSI